MGPRCFVTGAPHTRRHFGFSIERAVAPASPRGYRSLILRPGSSPTNRHSSQRVHCPWTTEARQGRFPRTRHLRAHPPPPCLLAACKLGAAPQTVQASQLQLRAMAATSDKLCPAPAGDVLKTSPPAFIVRQSPNSEMFLASLSRDGSTSATFLVLNSRLTGARVIQPYLV